MNEETPIRRETLLRRLGLAGVSAVAVLAAPAAAGACAHGRTPISQPPRPTPRAFMARAESLRRAAVAAGDQSFGAVLVREGRIVGLGPSRVVTAGDPTAHAELEAIRDAAARLGTSDLSGCVLYSTSAPCAMCETAATFAGIARLVVGPGLENAGAPVYGGR